MRLNALTSLRFFAAMGVFIHHFHFFEHTKSAFAQQVYKVFYEGFVGVTFFYILSGFIISYSYNQHKKAGKYSIPQFLRNRVARLYPTHLLTLAIAASVYLTKEAWAYVDMNTLYANILLAQSIFPSIPYFFGFNGVSWSVSTEMFFYLGFILLVTFNTKQLIGIWIALLAMIIWFLTFMSSSDVAYWALYINPVFRAVDFVTGMLLFRLYVSRDFAMTFKKATALEIVSLVALAGFAFVGMKHVNMLLRLDIYYIAPMAAVVFIFAIGKGWVSKLLSNRYLVLLGEASFSLYMIHQILINYAVREYSSWVNIDSMKSVITFMVPVILIGVVFSVVMYKLFEKPMNNLLRSKDKERQQIFSAVK
ncbi:acyltransferase [Pantoea sp.]|uniref:acyltransferase family protein n=1 Tax=Pantoea sp. TaxID=69393 RepID=UPI0031CE28C8